MGNNFSFESAILICLPPFLPFLCGKRKYLYNLEENLEDLHKVMQELNTMRDDLLRRISKGEDTGLQGLQEVKGWISMVEEIEPKANRLLDENFSEIQRLSRYGYCSLIPASTYRYCEKVLITLEGVKTLISNGVFEVVVHRALPPLVIKMPPIQLTVSQQNLFERACNFLEEKHVGTLGIYGRGGVGKTTLLTKIKNKFQETFVGLVIFVVVGSKEVESIQEEISNRLDLQLGRETKEGRNAAELFMALMGKKFLLLLDGIPREVDLDEFFVVIGVPSPSRENGCKVVFTTRSRDACGASKGVDAKVEITCLSPEEAWDLFQETVGENTLRSHQDIPKLARVVASTCRGLPLALNLIGETMSRKRTVREWRYTIHVLASSTAEFPDMENGPLPILKSIYDNMSDENIRLCFLYCALFPENCDIRKEDLVNYWIGEGILAKEDRERAEIQGYEIICDLVRMRLLMEGGNGYCVKMHGMVREMALWIASDFGRQIEHFVVVGGERIHQLPMVNVWGMVRRMSVTSTQIQNISDSLQCSELTTLFFRRNRHLKWISGAFFRWMTSLVVLDLSFNRELAELPEEVSSLVLLRFLNLSWTCIKGLPLGLKELRSLIHLDLDYTFNLQEVDVIASLLNLQVLRLFQSVPMDLKLLEDIQLLTSLKELSITVRGSFVLQRLLSIHRLASSIQRLHLTETTIADGGSLSLNAMFGLRELDILGCNIPEITIAWRSTIQRETVHLGNIEKIPQFRNIRTVTIRGCECLRELTWLLLAPSIRDLCLSECPLVEEVISKEKAMAKLGHTSEQPFQNLTKLVLNGLPKLKSIYWAPLPFPVLTYLEIRRCPELKRLPLNSESAIGNQVKMKIEEQWIKVVEWEDEATKQRFSHFNNRDFPQMAEDPKMDGLTSESHPIQNIDLVGTTGSGETATAINIRGNKAVQSGTHATAVTKEKLPPQSTSEERRRSNVIDTTVKEEITRMSDLVGGALVSEGLKVLIKEVKKVKAFKPWFKDLVSTMERLIPLTEQIESLQNKLDHGVGGLKELKETMKRAETVIQKCSRVEWYSFKRSMLTREIEQVDKDMRKFCQPDIQLRQYINQHKNLQILTEEFNRLTMPAPRVDLCSVPKLNMVTVGIDWPLKELKKKLLNDSVDRVVVSAPPGCGKTTLVTQICHDEDIKGKFKHIFFHVVSSTPNFRVIVQNLLQHNGYARHTFENDSQAGVGLRNLLVELRKGGLILLVLDDVWQGAEESLLDRFPVDLPGFKILVTSRFDFLSFGSTYHLKPLEDQDARDLLIHYASRPDHTSPDEYEDLLQKILKRCNGHPLVIKVVGASLKNRSITTWKGQVISWSKGRTVLDNPSPTVLERLQPSFDALDSNLKQCFLDMGSFLEDQKICASVIIDIWVELYGKTDSILCMKYLEDLAAHNLLDLVPLRRKEHEDGFYNDFLVTQHDILRELAISQSKSEENLERKRKRLNLEIRENKFPDWCLDLMQPINACLLSISTDDAFSSTWVEMDCPNVEALILNVSSLDYALPSFITRMKKLKVLTITNHGFFPTRLSNFSCLSLLPNLKRIRFEKASINLLDTPQLRLGSLEKLSLVMCSFGEVFYEEIDISEALPSLQEIDIDYCYDLHELPYWVYEVVSLKTLSITNCNKLSVLPEAIGNLSKLKVLRLCSCINLSHLPETTARLGHLQFLDISHCLGLRSLPLEIGALQKLKKISMRKCPECKLPDSVRNLEDLEVKCDEETAFLWKRFKSKMKNLRVHEEEPEHNLKLLQMF